MDEQLTLDVFGHREERERWRLAHQVGPLPLPWDTAGGGKRGDLVMMWRCCVCGTIDLAEMWLRDGHGCEYLPGRSDCRAKRWPSGRCSWQISGARPYPHVVQLGSAA